MDFNSLAILILLAVIYKFLMSGHSMPIFTNNSISEYRTVTLGGVSQSILIRSENKDNPVLLYVHGGPGNAETPFIVPYQKEWEKHFTVVNWDQRGCGRSYSENIDKTSLTTTKIAEDGKELTEYLKKTFNKDKIYLVAHSYGTYVGIKMIKANPENYFAYVGMGQIGNQQDNEKYLIDYAKGKALAENNKEALKELNTLGDLPYSKDNFGKKISLSRKWTTYYGGSLYNSNSANRFTFEAIIRPEYSATNLINYVKSEDLYYTNTADDTARYELFTANLKEEVPELSVPVYFIEGKNDYTVSFRACKEYFDVLKDSKKELIPIENCAHNPIVEKTDEVSSILIDKVLKDNQ